MRPLTRKPRGTMAAVRARRTEEVAAYFGSREAWEAIGDWSSFTAPEPSRVPRLLDHGYDETKDATEWTADDYAGAADFRGGELLSTTIGDASTPLVWRCAFGHVFAGSPRLILTAGHWCPDCVRDVAGYPRQAQFNQHLAQVETPRRSVSDSSVERESRTLGTGEKPSART
jgi:hypothetical protein